MREGLVDDEDTGALMFAVRDEDFFFVATALGVDLSRVKVLMVEEVQSGVAAGAALEIQCFVDVVVFFMVRANFND